MRLSITLACALLSPMAVAFSVCPSRPVLRMTPRSAAQAAILQAEAPKSKRKWIPSLNRKAAVPLVAAGALGVAYRCGVLPAPAQAATRCKDAVAVAAALVGSAVTSPAVSNVFGRIVLRLIDFGVPAVVIVVGIAALSGEEEDVDDDDIDDDGGVSLLRLLKGGKSKDAKALTKPPKEYIRVRRLTDRLNSFNYSLSRATGSEADALHAQRRRQLRKRFDDDLGSLSDGALGGLAAAEAAWRKEALPVAREVESARSEIRALAVKLGGDTAAPSAPPPGADPDESRLASARRVMGSVGAVGTVGAATPPPRRRRQNGRRASARASCARGSSGPRIASSRPNASSRSSRLPSYSRPRWPWVPTSGRRGALLPPLRRAPRRGTHAPHPSRPPPAPRRRWQPMATTRPWWCVPLPRAVPSCLTFRGTCRLRAWPHCERR